MIGIGIDVSKAQLDVAAHGETHVAAYANDAAGIKRLMRALKALGEVRIVVEASGGYEKPLLDACVKAQLWIARVNARQVRDFAKATGQLAKTDRLDAGVLALLASLLHTRLHRYEARAPLLEVLDAWVRRRVQVVEALVIQQQQLASIRVPAICRMARATIKRLSAERDALDEQIAQLSKPHVTPALKSMKGLGPTVQAMLLTQLPELGTLDRHAIAKLVGVAPLNRDSGTMRGERHIWGGRAAVRTMLYMAVLSALRWEPSIRATYKRLRERGKKAKVAIVACMRKFIVILNARRRDEINATKIMRETGAT